MNMMLGRGVTIHPLTIDVVKPRPLRGMFHPYQWAREDLNEMRDPHDGVAFHVEDESEPGGRKFFEHPALTDYCKTHPMWLHHVELSAEGSILVLRFANPQTNEYVGEAHRVTLDTLGKPADQYYLVKYPEG